MTRTSGTFVLLAALSGCLSYHSNLNAPLADGKGPRGSQPPAPPSPSVPVWAKSQVPPHYQRLQTLKNAERYTTAELREQQERVLFAEEELGRREAELFGELRSRAAAGAGRLQRAGDVLAYFNRLGTSNGPEEAINGRLEHPQCSAMGFRNLTNSIRPVNTPDDVKGMKVRTPPEIQIQASMEALGGIVSWRTLL